MATDLEKLVVQLSADIKGYEREMRKAVGVTQRQARAIEKDFLQMQRRIGAIGQQTARSFIAPFTGIAAALGGRELIRMTGEWTDLTSRVNLAAGSMEKGEQVMRRVSEMARRTYSDLSQTAEGYLAFSTTLTELGVSTDRQLDFVESLNNALVVSGAKGQTAERVMGALSKAMALGSLQGDNLNTVIESGGRVSQALAESMGVTTSELRKLGSEGKIGRRELLGITKEMEKLRREAGEMPGTIQDGFLLLNNALLEYVGRGDDAVGMSGRIAEALTVIADNFDTVADAGLKLAAVLAAGMLGRSIVGMIANLTNATGVLIRFGAALRAATSMASVSTAISGLSAAAGPLGMVMGGLLAGGVIMYADSAAEARDRTERLKDEMERLGYSTPRVSESIDEVTASLDDLTDAKRIEKIRDIQREISRLNDGSVKDRLFGGFGSHNDDTLIGLQAQAVRGQGWFSDFLGSDREALEKIEQVVGALRGAEMSAQQAIDALAPLEDMDLSSSADDLLEKIKDLIIYRSDLDDMLSDLGAAPDLVSANEELEFLLSQLDRMANVGHIDKEIADAVGRIIDVMGDGADAADTAHQALIDLGNANPDFRAAISSIAGVIARLRDLRAEAAATKASLPGIEGGGDSDTSDARQGAVTQAWVDEQRRLNSLSRERLEIERLTERTMQDAAKAGAALTREQAEQLAIEQVAANARRTEEGRSARSGGGGGRKGAKKKSEPGLFEDVERDLQNLEREIVLIGKSTQEVARARAEWAMLDEAKKRGIPVNDKLFQQIAAQADEIGKLSQEQERLANISDGVNSALRGAFDGVFDDPARALKDLGKQLAMIALQMQLVKSFPGAFGAGGTIPLGFASGGFTGRGGKYDFAGYVHKGEYVMDADTVRRAGGPKAFDALRAGLKGPGHAIGGYAGMPSIPSIPAMGRSAGGGAAVINIHNSGAPADVDRVETSTGPDGRQMFDIWLNESLASGRAAKGLKANGVQRPKVIR